MSAERPLTIPSLLARNRAERGADAALVTEDRTLTNAGLDTGSRELARRLVAAGVGKGARVGLMAPNGAGWAVTAMAVLRVGGVLVPLSTLLRPPELEAQLRVASVTHLAVAGEFRGRSYPADLEVIAPGVLAATAANRRHPALPALRRVWVLGDWPDDAVDDAIVAALEAAVRPADDLAILFTSGSRGVPKGTIHTQGSGLRATASSLEARRVGPGDRLYIPMPFFWTGGFASGLLSALVAGATLITEAVPEPDRTLALLERERVTLFRGWPDQAARLAVHPRFVDTDLSCLGPGSLAAVLPADQRPAPGARANLFGMTETFGPYSGDRLDLDLPPEARGSCGRPFVGVEVRIVDPDTGDACPPGVPGEIRLRGPNVMRGICGRTRERTFDDDGFYPTGDLGVLDAAGYLWFRGRRDDMFKVRGATVYPSEVEAALRALGGVSQAHVTNVVDGDGRDEVAALVVSRNPLPELIDGARARLSAFKVPTRWLVTDDADLVPMTATAKVDKAALQELLGRMGTVPG